jgi:hypothetical protein
MCRKNNRKRERGACDMLSHVNEIYRVPLDDFTPDFITPGVSAPRINTDTGVAARAQFSIKSRHSFYTQRVLSLVSRTPMRRHQELAAAGVDSHQGVWTVSHATQLLGCDLIC